MRAVFFGTPRVAVPYLDAVAEAGHEVLAVVTQPDRPAGRGRKLRPSEVKEAALARGLQVLEPEKARDPDFIAQFIELAPEVGVVVAYGQILRPELLAAASLAFVNVHYSLLPHLRGAAPVHGALREGLNETGVTIQHMARGLDAGDIILQRSLRIAEDDDRGTLTERLTDLGTGVLIEALGLLGSGGAPRVEQDHASATMVGRVRTKDCRVEWEMDAGEVRNLVRACTPWPGAWCMIDGKRVRVERATVVQKDLTDEGRVGEIVELLDDEGPVVATGDGRVVLTQLQPPGKRSMSGAEFLRGARLNAGDRLE